MSEPCDAFPLAPMQHAMWVGRHDSQPLGGVAGHLYVEFDGGTIDPERLRQRRRGPGTTPSDAAGAVSIRRKPADRSGPRARGLAGHGSRLSGARPNPSSKNASMTFGKTKSHQQLDGQVLELTLALLPGGSTRLHVDLDMQAADAMSYRTLIADLAKLYRGEQLPELRYSYREYRHEIARREAGPQPDRGGRSRLVGAAHSRIAGPATACRTRP